MNRIRFYAYLRKGEALCLKRLFEDGGEREGLELVDAKTFGTGVVHLIYRPSGKEGDG